MRCPHLRNCIQVLHLLARQPRFKTLRGSFDHLYSDLIVFDSSCAASPATTGGITANEARRSRSTAAAPTKAVEKLKPVIFRSSTHMHIPVHTRTALQASKTTTWCMQLTHCLVIHRRILVSPKTLGGCVSSSGVELFFFSTPLIVDVMLMTLPILLLTLTV